MGCVREMLAAVSKQFWNSLNMQVLDPCAGNGDYFAHLMNHIDVSYLMCYQINPVRVTNLRKLFSKEAFVTQRDFLEFEPEARCVMAIANPLFAVFNAHHRVNENHSLSSV